MDRKSARCIRSHTSDYKRSCILKILVADICAVIDNPFLRYLALNVRYFMNVKHIICLNIRLSAVNLDRYHLARIAFKSCLCCEVSYIVSLVRVTSGSKVCGASLQ